MGVYIGRMKQPLLTPFRWIFVFLLVLNRNSIVFGAIRPIAADTVAGHVYVVRKLSVKMCTLVAKEAQSPSFKQLTPQAAQEIVGRLFITAFASDSVAVLAMMSDAAKQNIDPHEVGRQLGGDVVGVLGRDCPASRPLITLLSKPEMAQQAAAADVPALSAAEQKALQPVVNKICAESSAADTKTTFANRAPDQRQALLSSLVEKEFETSRPQLLRYLQCNAVG